MFMTRKTLCPLFAFFILFASCGGEKKSKNAGSSPEEEKESSAENEEKEEEAPDLSWDRILDLTKELYADTEFDLTEEISVEEVLNREHTPLILNSKPSKKAKSYRETLSFQALEFGSPGNAADAFEEIKSTSRLWAEEKGFEDPDDRERFLEAFAKGGSTYALAGRFLLHHRLRCNMEEEDYKKDQKWRDRISELHPNGASLRMKCGYKLEE